MTKKLTTISFLLVLLISSINAQLPHTIGQPAISNYYHEEINSGSQNWALAQDQFGLMYFANNSGLLCYNGKEWKVFRLPNKTIVRALTIKNSKIFVGGQDALGYFFPNKNGVLQYHSLLEEIPKSKRQFGDVWSIAQNNQSIYFRSGYTIFEYQLISGKIRSFDSPPGSSWSFMEVCDGKLYAQNNSENLMVLTNNKWHRISTQTIKSPITSIQKYDNGHILIFTLHSGAYLLNNQKLISFSIPKRITESQILCSYKLESGHYAIGTVSGGIFIINDQGQIIRKFSGENGLQNNNVLSLFQDKNKVLWAGLDEGISLIDYNSPIQMVSGYSETPTPGYTSAILHQKLYIGTTDGVFVSPLNLATQQDISLSSASFKRVNGISRQVWSLFPHQGQVLMGHHYGSFIINEVAQKISNSNEGSWIFRPIPESTNLIVGTYEGIQLLQQKSDGYQLKKYSKNNVVEPLRFVEVDSDKHLIWASHPYRGVYKIKMNKDYSEIESTQLLTEKNGLPSQLNNFVFKINNEIIFTTEKGVYLFNPKTSRFVKSEKYAPLFGQMMLKFLVSDQQKQVWFATEKEVGVLSNGSIKYIPELQGKLIAGFENILPYNNNNVLVAAHKGLIHLNYNHYKQRYKQLTTLLNKVISSGKKDSLLFNGYFSNGTQVFNQQPKETILKLPAQFNSFHFEYSTDRYEQNANINYSYQLQGYDENWSSWSTKTSKDYTNIPYGKYKFSVKSRDNLGNTSTASSYSFEILPRWYQGKLAYTLYFISAVLIILLALQFHQKRLRKQEATFVAKQKKLKYIHDLELEKNENEIIRLKNDHLESKMTYKNKELAATTMHLFKRGRLLARIKEEINEAVSKGSLKNETTDLSKVLRLITLEERQEHSWEQFAIHFDEVHNRFLQKLKSQYPELTAGDLKLCAYLKMNLSSKEIAQLMHFSLKGIENGRYRLRKKFNLTNKDSLSNFILSFE